VNVGVLEASRRSVDAQIMQPSFNDVVWLGAAPPIPDLACDGDSARREPFGASR
jgi:hypothetical protein